MSQTTQVIEHQLLLNEILPLASTIIKTERFNASSAAEAADCSGTKCTSGICKAAY